MKLFLKYYDLFDHDTSTSQTHSVNFTVFTVSITLNLIYRPPEVADFGTNQCDLLLDLSSKISPILPRFRDIRAIPV